MAPSPLVSPDWLREHLVDLPGSFVLADVRWAHPGSAREAFERGHIPGAVSVDLDVDLSSPPFEGPGRHPLPAEEAFARTMSSLGVGDDTPVVVYDDVRGSVAARLWWMLDVLGHEVGLLDGGLDAWDGPLEVGAGPTPAPASFTPRSWPADRIAGAGAVAATLGDGSGVVLDVRAADRYRGEVEPFDRVAGHIPGALSAPWTDWLDPTTGRFLHPEVLGSRLAILGVAAGTDVTCYCGSGVTACHGLLALRVAGRDGRVYVGSWSDWSSDASRPVATGP